MEIENNFSRPIIVLSACLNSEPVRYNGEILHNDFVEKLRRFVDFITVCPELSIGLGVPRDPIRLYSGENGYKIIQPKTNLDFTGKMEEFSRSFLARLKDVDGFILKGKSPSCGVSGTKIYRDVSTKNIIKKGSGFFAMMVKEKFPYKPVEDELRLTNEEIRHHFLTRIFSFSEMRNLEKNISSIRDLIDFHTRYKYLLLLYNQAKLIKLGRIVAGYKKTDLQKTVSIYAGIFYSAFDRKPGLKRHINVIQHIFGYFSERLNLSEKRHFLSLIKKYQEQRIPLSTLTELLKNLAFRFDVKYLIFQRYLNPYPDLL